MFVVHMWHISVSSERRFIPMTTMQTFYERLSETASTTGVYQHYLALLTQASRKQVLEFKSDETWTTWWQ
jgi:hypothetical protein